MGAGAFVVLTAALTSAFFVLGRVSCIGRRSAIGVFAGLSLALYAQGNLIGINYGVLDGRKIDWNALFVPGCVNTAIWIVLVGLVAFAVVRFGHSIGEWVRIGALEGGGLKVPAATGPRRFHWYTWDGKWDNRAYLPTFSTLYFDESGIRCLPPDFKAKDEYRPDEICLLPSDGFADGQDLSGEWVWTMKKDAWIDVPVSEGLRNASFAVDVRVMPILGARRPRQTVRFAIDGKSAGEQSFSTAETWEKTVSLKVEPGQVRNGVVRVGFSLELPPERVCDIMDGNPDVRKLGMGFRGIRLKR